MEKSLGVQDKSCETVTPTPSRQGALTLQYPGTSFQIYRGMFMSPDPAFKGPTQHP